MKNLILVLASAWLALSAFAAIPGVVQVSGTIGPAATNSPYGTQTPRYGIGGLLTGASSLTTLQDLNWYPPARRQAGQVARLTTGAEYILGSNLTSWYNSGSVSNMAQLRTIEPGDGGTVVVDSYYGTNALGGGSYTITNSISGTNSYGGMVLALGGTNSWILSDPNPNVLQFGAVPSFLQYYTNNGNASQIAVDSTQPIQAAIDYTSSKGGGVVNIPSGDYKVGILYGKPWVSFKGAAPPTGFEVNLLPTNGISARVQGSSVLHGTYDTVNGEGAPILVLDGPSNFSLMNKVCFTSIDLDYICYYSGGVSVENISFMPGYRWSWNGGPPSSGVFVNQVDGVTIKNCVFGPVAGVGVYLLGARGAVIRDNVFRACVTSCLWMTDMSDSVVEGNTMNGNIAHVMLHQANTHEIKRNQLWNTREDLVRYSGDITLEIQFGQLRGFATERTGWSADPTTDLMSVNGGIGVDTGLPILIRGTGLPGGLETNRVYYVRFSEVTGITNWFLTTSAYKSLYATNTIDITSAGSGGWWCETLAGGVAAAVCEEVYVSDNRMDQNWDQSVNFDRITRGSISGNDIWEIAFDQGTSRFNTRSRSATGRGALIANSFNIVVSGNQFLGSYLAGINVPQLLFDYSGVEIFQSGSIVISANQMDWLTQGVKIDSQSAGINVDQPVSIFSGRPLLSDAPSIPSRFNGAQFRGTNWIIGTIPSAYTNVAGDYCIALNLQMPFAQTNNTYMPMFVLSGSTNGASPITSQSLVAFGYMFGTNMQMYLRQYGATTSDWTERRATMTEWCGKFSRLTFQRTNGVCQIWADGQILSAGRFTNGTDPGESAALYTPNVLLGTFSSNLYATNLMNRFSAIIGNAYGYPDLARAAAFSQRGNQVLHWDFIGASTTVPDLSGNGVIGNVVNLNPAIPITFGTP